jgi:hypothetical protein
MSFPSLCPLVPLAPESIQWPRRQRYQDHYQQQKADVKQLRKKFNYDNTRHYSRPFDQGDIERIKVLHPFIEIVEQLNHPFRRN